MAELVETPSSNNVTLAELLTVLQNSEDYLEQFDPSILVGTLQDKVDALHIVLEKMKATTEHLKELAKPLTAKAKAIENAREKLRDYIRMQMQKGNFDSLPGNAYKASLCSGKEKVVIETEREPTPFDKKEFGSFIRTDISFHWDHEAIEKAFLAGEELPPMVSADKTQTKWVMFTAHVPESLERKAKRKSVKS